MAEVTKEARVRAHSPWGAGAAERPLACPDQPDRGGRGQRPVAETLVKPAKPSIETRNSFLFSPDTSEEPGHGSFCDKRSRACPSRAGLSALDALARLEAQDERERRLRDELAEAEKALTEAQQDLDESRFEGERVAAEPLREARKRLREAGRVAQRRAVEVAEKRREFEQLDDPRSEEVCALAGLLFLHTAARGDHSEAWRQFSGQITPDDPELRQLLQAWRQLGHEHRRETLSSSPRISWLSRCSGLRRPS